MKKCLLLYLFLAAAGCRPHPDAIPVCKEVDVIGCRDSTLLLSALTDTVIYTPLEVAGSGLSDSWEPRLISFKRYLAVIFPDVRNNVCQIYTKNSGRFLGRLAPEKRFLSPGRERGYGVTMGYEMVTDETGNFLFGRSYAKEKDQHKYYWQTWDLRTLQRVDSVEIPRFRLSVASYFGPGRLALLHFNQPEQGDKVPSRVTVLDKTGKIVGTIPEHRTVQIAPGADCCIHLTDMISYRKGNTFRYYDANLTDTIFAVTDNLQVYPAYRFLCGDKAYPYYYEARIPANAVYDSDKYYTIHLPRESANYLFFQYGYEGDLYYGLYDTRSGRLKISREDLHVKRFRHSEGGLSNDIDGGLPFWPQIITDDDEAGSVQRVGAIRRRLSAVTDESLKSRPAYRNLSTFIRNLPDDTYVVATVRIVR